MNLLHSLLAGAAGAVVLNLVHESARRVIPDAPEVQRIGMRAIARPMRAAGHEPPPEDRLYRWAMAGDLASNALYYGLVGAGGRRGAWARGAALGALGGVGAVVLPGPLGLGSEPVARTPATAAMTVAWYTLAGLAAAGAYRALAERR